MIRMKFTPLMMKKVEEVIRECERLWGSDAQEKDELSRQMTGLSFPYLCQVGKRFESPSERVVVGLGLELWVRDPETEEMERVPLEDICDWNPRNPRMRVSSTSE